MNNMKWTFYQVWNESLEENKGSRVLSPRQKIWASELGGSYIDRYLKMKGVPPTNPPNPRSLRKFEAGNIWEAIVGYVLRRAGILQIRQEWLEYQYPSLLPVSGRLDFIGGGKPDISKALDLINKEFTWLPEFISRATANIVQRLVEEHPEGLENIILEIKSCSSFMFEKYEKDGKASPQHKSQLFHYLKAKNMAEGHIVYICKDDARMLEIGVYNPSEAENFYKKDIETMSNFVYNDIEPEKEKPIVYDDDWGKFSANWKVGYSTYLTKLYGLADQKEFDDKFKPTVERWNRVAERIRDNKEMTDKNKEVLEEIVKEGFDIELITKGVKNVVEQ
jgi:hypothetical protein